MKLGIESLDNDIPWSLSPLPLVTSGTQPGHVHLDVRHLSVSSGAFV